ncbi:hypothetical protein COOONC_00928 [Cooperia oncophora]
MMKVLRDDGPLISNARVPAQLLHDEGSLQSKFHAKVGSTIGRFQWRNSVNTNIMVRIQVSESNGLSSGTATAHPTCLARMWMPPRKNIVQFFANMVLLHIPKIDFVVACSRIQPIMDCNEHEVDFDSNGEAESNVANMSEYMRNDTTTPKSIVWQLLRLAVIEQQIYRIHQFLKVAGFDLCGKEYLQYSSASVFSQHRHASVSLLLDPVRFLDKTFIQ